MQLLILLAMLLMGGNDVDNLLKQVQPLLKNFGGGDMQSTLKQAEELYGIVTALQSIGASGAQSGGNVGASGGFATDSGGKNDGFALAPIADIADNDIICRMTKYITENQ